MLYKADSSILVKIENDPLCGYTKEEFSNVLKSSLAGRVEEAWLFGSYTGNSFGKFSDIDLILVCETKLSFQLRNRMFDDLYDLGPEMDILVYTPLEFSDLKSNPSTGFWKTVTETMVQLV